MKTNKTLITVLLVALAVLGIYSLAKRRDDTQSSAQLNPPLQRMNEGNPSDTVARIIGDPLSESTPLTDLTGGNSRGTAYILRSNGLSHYIIAQLPELEESRFYEGWLVADEASNTLISTGRLLPAADGTYELTLATESEYEGYNRVVVTEEETDDKQPERPILVGSFE